MNPLRIAVVGGGHLGRIHARLLAATPGVELVAVADPIAAAREQAAACALAACATGFASAPRAVADYRELLGHIDAAVVATPTQRHRDVAGDLIAAGVHVFVEKPIAMTTAEADEMVAAARQQGVVLQVGHVERFNPVWKLVTGQAAELIDGPRYIEAVRCGPYTFRSTDVGVVRDLMVHDVDIVLSLVGSPVAKIDAVGQAVLGPHEDIACARIAFANGAVANLTASRVSYETQRRMRIFAAGGYASLDFNARTATLVAPTARVAAGDFAGDALTAEEQTRLKEQFFTEVLSMRQLPAVEGNAIADELVDFADSIRAGREPRVTGEAGRAALAVCEQIAAQIATWSGRDKARTLSHPAVRRDDGRRQAG